MKLMKMFFAMACVVGVVGSGFGQGLQTKTPGTLGYLDPETGTFRILPTRSNSAETPATVSSGKFVVSFTITVSSAIAASAKIACIANATAVETSIAFETIETAGRDCDALREYGYVHRKHPVFVEFGEPIGRPGYLELRNQRSSGGCGHGILPAAHGAGMDRKYSCARQRRHDE